MILMSLKLRLSAVVAAISLIGLSACSTAPADSGKLNITAAFYPFAFIAERVGGDLVEVSNLTQPGAEPHDLELSAQQIATMADSDLVIYQAQFQTAVDKAIETATPKNVVNVADSITMMDATASDEDEHSEHSDEAADDHAHAEGLDPHTWLDPNNMAAFTTAVANKLSEISPDHADTFAQNAKALQEELKTLDTSYSEGLATCKIRQFVSSHAAFGYLAKAYDLTQISIAGLDPSVEPTTARIAEIQQLVKKYGITTIFYETLTSPAVADSLAQDLKVSTDILDPIEGVTSDSRGTTYIEIMDSNLEALRKANTCS